jgi:sugar/nucleoside kinase (ribokinase family)
MRDKLLELADYKAISYELAGKITGIKDPQKQVSLLSGRFGGICLVTKGPDGLWVNLEKGVLHIPSYKVETVDTTGAGDTFHGALAAALDLAFPTEQAIRCAIATAALKCTGKGHDSLPDMEMVQHFLKDARG